MGALCPSLTACESFLSRTLTRIKHDVCTYNYVNTVSGRLTSSFFPLTVHCVVYLEFIPFNYNTIFYPKVATVAFACSFFTLNPV